MASKTFNPSSMANVVDPYEDAMVQYLLSLRLTGEEHGVTDMNPSRISNQWSQQQESPVQTQLYSGNSVSNCFNNSIWGERFFSAEGNFEHGLFSYEPRDIPNYHRQFRGIEHNQPYYEKQNIDIIALMVDEKMHAHFQRFLDACDRDRKQMDLLVEAISLQSESFLNAAFCRQGLFSITKLIRKLKKSNHATTITRILSIKFLELMTHHKARQVINLCFIHFRHEHNEILYECTINHCLSLAKNKVGCEALYDCFNTISGQQKARLLDSLASKTDILCDDHYGNYVLQKVMELSHIDVNAKIFNCLRGKFLQLAQRKVGSHTVEKCMGISQTFLLSVIEEMLESPQTPPMLAQHSFGNYVVQKALLLTKKQGLVDLYKSLVNSLEPHFPALMKTAGGRKVIGVIRN